MKCKVKKLFGPHALNEEKILSRELQVISIVDHQAFARLWRALPAKTQKRLYRRHAPIAPCSPSNLTELYSYAA